MSQVIQLMFLETVLLPVRFLSFSDRTVKEMDNKKKYSKYWSHSEHYAINFRQYDWDPKNDQEESK